MKHYITSKRSTLICLSIVSATSLATMSILAPFFPLVAARKGMRESISSLVFAVFAITTMIFSLVCGKLIPTTGAKRMLIAGALVSGVANISFGQLDKIDDLFTFTVSCFTVRIVEAMASTALTTAICTIVMSVFSDNIGKAFGIIDMADGLGVTLGPAIGGILYGKGGYALPFNTLGALLLLNIPLCLYIIKPLELTNKRKGDSNTYLQLISNPRVAMVGLVVMFGTQTMSFLEPTIEPHFRRTLNASPEYVAFAFLIHSGTYALSAPIVGWYSDRIHNQYSLMASGMLLMCTGLIIVGPSAILPLNPSLTLSVTGMGVIGVAYAVAILPTFGTLLELALEEGFSDTIHTYSLVSGLWYALSSLGEVIGPSIGGYLSDRYGFSTAASIMAGFTSIGSTLILNAQEALITGIMCFNVSSLPSMSDTDIERSFSSERMNTSPTNYMESEGNGDNEPLLR